MSLTPELQRDATPLWGAIQLHPRPEARLACPRCGASLAVSGWRITGMRNLAQLKCAHCNRDYFGDLATGHGLLYPMLLDPRSGQVVNSTGAEWFAEWLRAGYRMRSTEPVALEVEELRPARKIILLNCLDRVYGHALLKLLNAQAHLDRSPEIGLAVLVQKPLRWLVPAGAASVWTVDLPFARGHEWSDGLADSLAVLVGRYERCWLSQAAPHPHPRDFDIARFTGVQPFPLQDWDDRLDRPSVTFIWREDRTWPDQRVWLGGHAQRAVLPLQRAVLGTARRQQTRAVTRLAEHLRRVLPRLQFSVVGLGQPGRFPDWISDLRAPRPDEATERRWCEAYGQSHLVVGVVGSNMLLPSAHAGAVVDLLPPDRLGNYLEDVLVREGDPRETLFRTRVLPVASTPADIAHTVHTILVGHAGMRQHFLGLGDLQAASTVPVCTHRTVACPHNVTPWTPGAH